ncbi:MAG: hypothetical protein K9N47_11690 [Prosthecobacter sp.]|nr:hypothetical protein [Prosthecobacter sp.]
MTGGLQGASFIGEADLYRLVMSSKLDGAVTLKDWIVEEVLPASSQNRHARARTNQRADAPADGGRTQGKGHSNPLATAPSVPALPCRIHYPGLI